MLPRKIHGARAVEKRKHGFIDPHDGRRKSARLRHLVGEVRQNGARARGIARSVERGDRLCGERGDLVEAVKRFERIVVDGVERKFRSRRETVLDLGVDARLLAVVEEILRRPRVKIRGLCRRILVVADRAETRLHVFAVEEIDCDAQVALAAKHIEDFLI